MARRRCPSTTASRRPPSPRPLATGRIGHLALPRSLPDWACEKETAMKTRAAVAFEAKQPLEIGELGLAGPKAGEVLVEVMRPGICPPDAYTLDVFAGQVLFPRRLVPERTRVGSQVEGGVKRVDSADYVDPHT